MRDVSPFPTPAHPTSSPTPVPPMPARNLVVIPTYDEIENLESIVTRTLQVHTSLDVLVVDDNSPDGTGALADRIAARTGRVHVLHRAGKEGLGAAYLAGFAWALEHDYDTVVEMDAGQGPTGPSSCPASTRP